MVYLHPPSGTGKAKLVEGWTKYVSRSQPGTESYLHFASGIRCRKIPEDNHPPKHTSRIPVAMFNSANLVMPTVSPLDGPALNAKPDETAYERTGVQSVSSTIATLTKPLSQSSSVEEVPVGWKRVPSRTKTGVFSYLHEASGVRCRNAPVITPDLTRKLEARSKANKASRSLGANVIDFPRQSSGPTPSSTSHSANLSYQGVGSDASASSISVGGVDSTKLKLGQEIQEAERKVRARCARQGLIVAAKYGFAPGGTCRAPRRICGQIRCVGTRWL